MVFELIQKPVGTLDLLLYLERHGRARVTTILADTGLNRETFYSAADRLKSLGFVFEEEETGFPVRVFLGLTRQGQDVARLLAPLATVLASTTRALEDELGTLERQGAPETISRRMEVLELLVDRDFLAGHWDAAQERATRFTGLASQGGNRASEARGRLALGRILQKRDRHEDATRELEAALQIADEADEASLASEAHYLLGSDLERRGRWAEAMERFVRAAALAERGGDALRKARAEQAQGRVLGRQGELQRSLTVLRENAEVLEALGAEDELPRAYASLGSTAYNLKLPEAVDWFDKAVGAARRVGDVRIEAYGLSNAAAHWIDAREFRKAETQLQRARAIFVGLEERSGLGAVELNTGYLNSSQGRWSAAESAFEAARALSRETSNRYQEASALLMQGQMMKRRDRGSEAQSLIREARRIFSELGASARIARCDEELRDLS